MLANDFTISITIMVISVATALFENQTKRPRSVSVNANWMFAEIFAVQTLGDCKYPGISIVLASLTSRLDRLGVQTTSATADQSEAIWRTISLRTTARSNVC